MKVETLVLLAAAVGAGWYLSKRHTAVAAKPPAAPTPPPAAPQPVTIIDTGPAYDYPLYYPVYVGGRGRRRGGGGGHHHHHHGGH